MIAPNELRIGNLVLAENDTPLRIDSVCEWGERKLRPIPLTEDVLKSAGFYLKAEKGDPLYTGWYFKAIDESNFGIRIWWEEISQSYRWSINEYYSVWVQSLHQLQNLYFALFQKELTINL